MAPLKKKVFLKTFGCQMNEYDSEKLLGLIRNDYCISPSVEKADLILLNTCSVRYKAEKKLYDILGILSKLKRDRQLPIIGVCGCVAQQEGARLLRRAKCINFVVGTHNISLVPSLIKNAERGLPRAVCVEFKDCWDDLEISSDVVVDELHISPKHSSVFGAYYSGMRAFVAIQRGCNKHCSFCVVPSTRGPEVSRSVDEILREVRAKVAHGAKEVMLLGQTVNSFGRDLSPKITFEELVKRILEISGVMRLRFVSPHPHDVTDGFIDLYRQYPQLCSHIHLPVQSGSDKILRLMRRNYRIGRYLDIVAALKQVRPDIAITTDFIVGFPYETAEDFQKTLNILHEVNYSFSYSFKYSPRPNTSAASISKDAQVTPDEGDRRLYALQDAQKRLSLQFNQAFVGEILPVYIEGNSTTDLNKWRARTDHNISAEIIGGSYCVGDLIERKVESASPYGLRLAN